jgi:hypothetical protein
MTTKQDKLSRGTAGRIAEARLKRLTHQNEKLHIEVQRLRGEVGPIEAFKQMVLKANSVVRSQFLGLPHRLSSQMASTADPRECATILEAAIVRICNDLAFEKERPPQNCPTCGRGMEEEGGRAGSSGLQPDG